MGKEYSIVGVPWKQELDHLMQLRAFRKFDSEYNLYYFGESLSAKYDWPPVTAHIEHKESSLTLTVYEGNHSAWDEMKKFFQDLRNRYQTMSVLDPDTEEDVSREFFGED